MAFIPKNQYKVKYTYGKELYNPKTNSAYSGYYIDYRNRYFAGKSSTNLGDELKRIEQFNQNMIPSKIVQLYNALNKPYYKKIKNRKAPPSSITVPKQENYNQGYFTRYFCKRINTQSGFREISKETFDGLKVKTFDLDLYLPGLIQWSLVDEKINTNNILLLENPFPGIRFFFNNATQYFKPTQENLTAKQNELFYLDGTPFPEGEKYHIHPTKGPMVGAFHIQEPHSFLTFSKPITPIPILPSTTPPPLETDTPPPPPPQQSPSIGSGY